MIYNLGILDNIGDTIVQALRSLMGSIIASIFEMISTLYQVFIYISKAQIVDNEYIYPIYRKVGFILSLFMIFKLSFVLIQTLVNPDKLTDNKKSFAVIIGRCVISIVLLGITPTIFKEALSLQNLIVGGSNRDNVIYKFIVNKSTPGDFNTLGRRLTSDLYFSFFTDVEEPKMNDDVINSGANTDQANRFPENNIDNLKKMVEEGDNNNLINSFHDTVPYLALKGDNGKYVIEFHYFYLLGFGIACLWFFVTYCIQVGLRVIQLAYLQIIAPIPILSYISDPEGTFKNWIKQCTTTYLDLFIRLAIIYFTMTLIGDILEQFKNSSGIIIETTGLAPGSSTLGMVKIFIIIGLLLFTKKVPELLKELFPNLGGGAASLGFGLKSPKNTLADIPLLGGAANKVLGYAGNLGKKAGKFAWSHTGGAAGRAIWNKTGGKVKAGYNRWQENRKNAAEIKEMEKPGRHLYNKYGEDITQAFKHSEYKNSYVNLKRAKDENRAAEREYEMAKASGDSVRLTNAINRKNAAAKALSDAQKTHDNMKKRYGADARREEAFDLYKSMHPDMFSSGNNSSSYADTTTTTNSNNNSNNNNSNNNSNNSNKSNSQKSSSKSNQSEADQNQPITEQNSVFANMSDTEWAERQAENERDIYASQNDPNEYFDKMGSIYANEYLENDGVVSDEFNNSWEAQTKAMEDAYKKAGWTKGDNGKWNKSQ